MLTVVETLTLHDGEPAHWWEWTERGDEPTDEPLPDGPAAEHGDHKP